MFTAEAREPIMSAYAVAHLRSVDLGPEIFEYIARIDATLEPFGGRFLIHGGPVDSLDGHWSGDLVVIEFPNRESAHAWYASPGYQAILRLRTDNSDGGAFIVDGLPDRYRAADALAKLMPARV
jgi:uncharacterized protein (DUF1330 family)